MLIIIPRICDKNIAMTFVLKDVCVHELGHASGLQHEQQSPLYNNYLDIHYSNIRESQYSKLTKLTIYLIYRTKQCISQRSHSSEMSIDISK